MTTLTEQAVDTGGQTGTTELTVAQILAAESNGTFLKALDLEQESLAERIAAAAKMLFDEDVTSWGAWPDHDRKVYFEIGGRHLPLDVLAENCHDGERHALQQLVWRHSALLTLAAQYD